MNETPLEDQVHDALHRRADGVQRAPFDVGDVRTRARRIQRRRALAAGAAVAAVLAIAVPVGLTMVGQAQRSDVPPAPQPPPAIASGTVRVDARSAPVEDGPEVPMINVVEPTFLVGDEAIPLPEAYDSLVAYRDGWLATVNVEGDQTVQVLDSDFQEVDGDGRPTTGLTVSADESRIAWAEYDGTRWVVVDRATDGSREDRRTELPAGPEDASVTTVGFVSDTEVLASLTDPDDYSQTTFVADGTGAADLPGIVRPWASSATTGMAVGVTRVKADSSSCSSVVDARSRTGEPLWSTCDHTLVSFSPDGSYVVGFSSYLDANGSPTLAILDADTGEVLLDFDLVGPRQGIRGIHEVAWEDDDSMLATLVSGAGQYVVRLGLDGTVGRIDVDLSGIDPSLVPIKFAASQAGT
ncbi:hypothetical protein EUA93_02235 [Nocardioides oleivorans]|uniref:WD40 repeat domain-containing protein n=1 Tax=Nocardioides oleivorans TaxID=273676 RepID=A0A4Q2RWX7_9ACTN|nr:hypothetical protein [Nocardioides oleivorans]RYB93276.1 hypothetical protein EUA93_02235 [Nocardioides oleivorans]